VSVRQRRLCAHPGVHEMVISEVRRSDFSHALVHLTRERREFDYETNKPKALIPPFQVLKEILTTGILRGGKGYVKGNRPAVCFSEIPLSQIHRFAEPPSALNAKYRFYGLVLSKKTVFEMGGRPVIYLPDTEGEWIPADEKWRHVRFEHGTVDWTHEREWRVPGDIDLTKVAGAYLLVWNEAESIELAKFNTPVRPKIRGILPMEHLIDML
jgi:hypothetical protein